MEIPVQNQKLNWLVDNSHMRHLFKAMQETDRKHMTKRRGGKRCLEDSSFSIQEDYRVWSCCFLTVDFGHKKIFQAQKRENCTLMEAPERRKMATTAPDCFLPRSQPAANGAPSIAWRNSQKRPTHNEPREPNEKAGGGVEKYGAREIEMEQ